MMSDDDPIDGSVHRSDGEPDISAIHPETDRILLDVMLDNLAVYLRLCGFDTATALGRGVESDDRIAEIADRENRRLCTRDIELANRVRGSILLSGRELETQLAELREAGVELTVTDTPTYCGRCNGRLAPVDPDASTPPYAPDPDSTDCWRCRVCEQVFWHGSHWERMRTTIEEI